MLLILGLDIVVLFAVGLCFLLSRALNFVNFVVGLCDWTLFFVLLLAAPLLVLLLAAPLNSGNSVVGFFGWALFSSCFPLGRAPELC